MKESVICIKCKGKIKIPFWKTLCPECSGAGRIFPDVTNPKKPHGKCERCDGRGTVPKVRFKFK